jgi:hypothetical protein
MAPGLAGAIHGHALKPGDPGFQSAAHVFNPRFDAVLPRAVARWTVLNIPSRSTG